MCGHKHHTVQTNDTKKARDAATQEALCAYFHIGGLLVVVRSACATMSMSHLHFDYLCFMDYELTIGIYYSTARDAQRKHKNQQPQLCEFKYFKLQWEFFFIFG